MLSERKALTIMFEELQEDRRQAKQDYRNTINNIDSRLNDILNRLQRLDDLEREAVDVEGVLISLSKTAQQLAELLPSVPADQMIERAAAMIAREAAESGAKIEVTNQEGPETVETIPDPVKQEMKQTATFQPNLGIKHYMDIVEQLLKETGRPMRAREIGNELKKKYGWEWGNFGAAFNFWRRTDPRPSILKVGNSYKYYDITSEPKEGDQENEIIETTDQRQ